MPSKRICVRYIGKIVIKQKRATLELDQREGETKRRGKIMSFSSAEKLEQEEKPIYIIATICGIGEKNPCDD